APVVLVPGGTGVAVVPVLRAYLVDGFAVVGAHRGGLAALRAGAVAAVVVVLAGGPVQETHGAHLPARTTPARAVRPVPLQAGQVTRRVARVPSWWRVPVVIAAVAKPSQSRQTRVFEACWGMMRLPFRVRWIWKVRAVRGGGSLAREPPRRALASAVA